MNYLGQGALVLSRPEAVGNPFFMMAPDWAPDNLADRIAIAKAQLMSKLTKVMNPTQGPTLNNVIGAHLVTLVVGHPVTGQT